MFLCSFRYCLQHSPVPVIVVHPSQRRLHRKQKRVHDPERQSYISLLTLANAYASSSDSLHPSNSSREIVVPDISLDTPGASDTEVLHGVTKPIFTETDFSGEERPTLRHYMTAPAATSSTTTTHRAEEAALDRQRENMSPTDKG